MARPMPRRPRDNPFATRHLNSLTYRLHGATWAELLARLDRLGGRGAVVGPRGRGKTALLEALAPLLSERGLVVRWLRPEPPPRPWPPGFLTRLAEDTGPDDALLVDGAERLTTAAWWRFSRTSRRAGVLVATTHRPGRLPTLHVPETSVALLRELTEELLGRSASDLAPLLADLFEETRGDLRRCLLRLYDHWGEAGAEAAAR